MIRKFIKEYGLWYLIYSLIAGLFCLTFWLYHLPLAYFINSLALNIVILLGFSLWLYIRFYSKLKQITSATVNLELTDLKMWQTPSDQAYQTIIADLKAGEAEHQLQAISQIRQLESVVKMRSHQMKVPISAISLMAQTDNLDKQEVRQQLLRLQNYLSTLLAYFKFSQHQDDFRFENISVRKVAVDLVKTYRIACLAKELSVEIEGEWQIKTDKKWLTFAISQILDNAIKYSRPQGKIILSMTQTGLTITDQGLGILPEDLPRLFEEGFTGYNGHEHQKATGFGLYMTKQILDSLELSIRITSQVGQGTSVRITKS
ncbi:OmpR family two component system bacitracin resistance sensor histidine kinase [Streptococcus criceti]|uniref:histidine kinase n=1 Tax=Streptococcus criceti HS-6 TaxID=873449 RepID=G5JSQ7_STRCG|nr:sensor histidine kinase [Streptococcus criceti]EHI73766.1 sensor histidine kinase [Streptococcus criceti HS-6]SUN37536.1 OmpR family two component system bacitracin resistance sensor histidine kinase [Streptococcus criceti]